jgi:1,4-dihydroxy-2-naphthoate octaprenyltransferase/chlorophyll synthase
VSAGLGELSTRQRWLYATKPGSWPKLLVPALLGQALGAVATGEFLWPAALIGLAFTVFDLLFVVFLNDVGDIEVDRIKRQMFPDGCSPKTIPDGILPATSVLVVGVIAGLLATCAAWFGEVFIGRAGLGLAGTVCLLMFVAYTFPPVRLNYRGGGELLEMLGVGVALPWFHVYLQSGELLPDEIWLLAGFVALSLASAVASGLSDEESDRKGGKTTFTTRFGNARARSTVEFLVVLAALGWALSTRFLPAVMPPWVGYAVLVVVVLNLRRMKSCSALATTNAFAAQKQYKHFLHRAIWHSTAVLSVLLLLRAWWT